MVRHWWAVLSVLAVVIGIWQAAPSPAFEFSDHIITDLGHLGGGRKYK
jgi:hypothetical membrane protein